MYPQEYPFKEAAIELGNLQTTIAVQAFSRCRVNATYAAGSPRTKAFFFSSTTPKGIIESFRAGGFPIARRTFGPFPVILATVSMSNT